MIQKIDELDLKILRELQKDARQSYRDLADKLGVAEGTIYNRIHKLKDIGVIKRFIPDIDFSKLGYDLTAIIGIRVEGSHLPEIEKEISKEKNVSAVYDITGEYDCIVVAKFKTRYELNNFVKKILSMPHVKRNNTMVGQNVMKEDHGIKI
ncbi:MAG: AsnC family transcriptional regulator [Candidatus Altiarchaeales archaeon]|nr:MAG: AsnC family transcriptional regulator [Candidatus Altiarchaeales archaeon]